LTSLGFIGVYLCSSVVSLPAFFANLMRIKIIGDNNCARATRHLLRMGGFAVSEYIPAEAITRAPHFGYVITIELAPAPHPGPLSFAPGVNPSSAPDFPPQHVAADGIEEASAFAKASADLSALATASGDLSAFASASVDLAAGASMVGASSPSFCALGGSGVGIGEDLVLGAGGGLGAQVETCATGRIHFDSVDSELEAAVLRHVARLSAGPVVVDRPGGVVRSERELRIVVPLVAQVSTCAVLGSASDGLKQNGLANYAMDEAAAVAVEFGVLRGLLDLVSPPAPAAGNAAGTGEHGRNGPRKKWWSLSLAVVTFGLLAFSANLHAAPLRVVEMRGVDGAYLHLEAALAPRPGLAAEPAQGQFAIGQQTRITDGANTMVVDPCKGQTKLYVSINQTANTQLAVGTAAKKIYICSIHVVVAAATNVALVEGTGSVCATGTAGVSGFGGATAATGWNFAANGGIALGNGDAAVGAEGTAADNLCLFNSAAGQVSGGISYVVQ
jgi:hypothetical protein